MGAKITTVAMYVSDRDIILSWMKAGETFRDKIHELVQEKLNQESKGGSKKKEDE